MTLVQDPTHPTGISDDTPRGNSEVARARIRKAHAAMALRAKFVDWDDIAEQLGYPTGDACQVATEQTLEQGLFTDETQEFLRGLASERLNQLLEAVYTQATNTDHPDQLAFHAAALKTIAQHTKLMGYEAPQVFTVNNPSASRIEQWVASVLAQGTEDIEEKDIFEAEIVESEDGDYGMGQEESREALREIEAVGGREPGEGA